MCEYFRLAALGRKNIYILQLFKLHFAEDTPEDVVVVVVVVVVVDKCRQNASCHRLKNMMGHILFILYELK